MTHHTLTDVTLWREGATQQGRLTVREDELVFEGQTERLTLSPVQFVSIERPARLTPGVWVKVETGGEAGPATVYFKEQPGAGGARPIFDALRHFPNSGHFDCWTWTAERGGRRGGLRSAEAPRNPWKFHFAVLKRAVIAATDPGTLRLSVRGLRKPRTRNVPLTRVKGYTRETLTAKRQLLSLAADTLLLLVGLGLLMGIAGLLLRPGNGEDALPAFAGFALWFLIGMGIGLMMALIHGLPTLFRVRTFELFYLDGVGDLGVLPPQAESLANWLTSHEISER